MHFLCLHGIGSNSVRFHAQIAAIIASLGDDYTYDIPDGPLPSAPACDMFEQLAWTKAHNIGPSTCYSFYDWSSPSSILSSLDWLASYVSTHGPFDGVISFSQSTCLVSTFLIYQHELFPELLSRCSDPVFKCAIFFQGILPVDARALRAGYRRQIGVGGEGSSSEEENAFLNQDGGGDGGEEGVLLQMPSLHVWGTNDTFPLAQGEQLSRLFGKAGRSTVVHELGHGIPGAGDREGVRRVVRGVRRTVERGEMVH